MTTPAKGGYDADDDIVDYILGITFEIWEEGGVDLIHQYYASDCVVWGLDGITHGAAAVVDGTHATLRGFPDRLLLAENVIWSGNRADGYYTSHRLLSLAGVTWRPHAAANSTHGSLRNASEWLQRQAPPAANNRQRRARTQPGLPGRCCRAAGVATASDSMKPMLLTASCIVRRYDTIPAAAPFSTITRTCDA